MVPARCAPVRQQHHSPPGPRHGTTPLWPSASTSIIDASAAVNGGGPSLRCSLCSGGAGRVGYHRSGQYFAALAVYRASLPRFFVRSARRRPVVALFERPGRGRALAAEIPQAVVALTQCTAARWVPRSWAYCCSASARSPRVAAYSCKTKKRRRGTIACNHDECNHQYREG